MAKFPRIAGSTSQSINVYITNINTGLGLTGLVFNSAGLAAYYTFTGANAGSAVITLGTLVAVNSAWASGGFKEVDATNMPGVYRLDVPNAVLAASKGNLVNLLLQGAANMAPCPVEINLTAVDDQSTGYGLVNASANVSQINASSTSAANLALTTQAIGSGTVGAASTTTSIVTSALTPTTTSANQLVGRTIIFSDTTTTTGLRGQAAVITASTTGGVLTVAAMTNAPVSGDTFTIT